MKKILLVISCILAYFQTFGQPVDPKLTIEWTGDLKLGELIIQNHGKSALPATGWKLYFNRSNFSILDSSIAKIEHINGDLFTISPEIKFQPIPLNGAVKIPVALKALRNITDYPEGIYFVWDKYPDKGYNISSFTVIPPKESLKSDLDNANRNFAKNKIIETLPFDSVPKIFPTPANYSKEKGTLHLAGRISINADKAFNNELEALSGLIENWTGLQPSIINTNSSSSKIYLKKNSILDPEAYHLRITSKAILIEASDAAGAFYAIQSLKSSVSPKEQSTKTRTTEVPCLDITDRPRFKNRMLMLDVARNFRSKQQVLKVLDLMAMYKLNALHFHFSDDEGWRIEIPGLPELTTVGAKRGHTTDKTAMLPPSFGSGASMENKNGSGYYTTADYIDIIKYANARHISIIPEIESPGHAHAAIMSMEARYFRLKEEGRLADANQYLLSDLTDKSAYQSVQGWKDNVINVSLPSTYSFMEKVTSELIKMHKLAGQPLTRLHLGGDEVPIGVWEKSPKIEAFSKQNPTIKSTSDLWTYYFNKIDLMLKQKGLSLSGWEEIGLKKVIQNGTSKYVPQPLFKNRNFSTDVWNNIYGAEELAYDMANGGYKVMLTPVTNMYFDLAADPSYFEQGQYWGGFIDVDKPFKFIPLDYYKNHNEDNKGQSIDPSIYSSKTRLTPQGIENILGLQGALWSEVIKSDSLMEYMLFPKLLGLAERAWAPAPDWANESSYESLINKYNNAWSLFINTVAQRELPRLSKYGVAYRIPTPGLKVQENSLILNAPYPGMKIRYTTDGTEPEINSNIYEKPLDKNKEYKFRLFDNNGKHSRTLIFRNL